MKQGSYWVGLASLLLLVGCAASNKLACTSDTFKEIKEKLNRELPNYFTKKSETRYTSTKKTFYRAMVQLNEGIRDNCSQASLRKIFEPKKQAYRGESERKAEARIFDNPLKYSGVVFYDRTSRKKRIVKTRRTADMGGFGGFEDRVEYYGKTRHNYHVTIHLTEANRVLDRFIRYAEPK